MNVKQQRKKKPKEKKGTKPLKKSKFTAGSAQCERVPAILLSTQILQYITYVNKYNLAQRV